MFFRFKKYLCILLLFLLIFIIIFQEKGNQKKRTDITAMTWKELSAYHRLIMELVSDSWKDKTTVQEKMQKILINFEEQEEDHVGYHDFIGWYTDLQKIFREEGLIENSIQKSTGDMEEPLIEELRKDDQDTSEIDRQKAEEYIDIILKEIDTENKIQMQSLMVLGDHTTVRDLEGKPIEENHVFTNNGRWEVSEIPIENIYQKEILCLTYHGKIWSVREIINEAELENVWIEGQEGEQLTYFYKNYYVKSFCPKENMLTGQVADLVFRNGRMEDVAAKTEKMTGKPEKITEEEILFKEEGRYLLSEQVQYYRLYGTLQCVGRNEIPLEEGMADFVIEDGKIQAVLLVRDEKMEKIRVLLKTKDFADIYHESITVSSDTDLEMISDGQIRILSKGEEISFSEDSEAFLSNKIYIRPKALTGRIYLTELEREDHNQGYLGWIEIERREEGLLLINELSLEEYLYSVVPSEMPSSYPMEALKAQAISARTYAYKKMKSPALAEYGANLDDSTSYQVYHNIPENGNTTRAVKETKGQILFYFADPAEIYYYSTSCGYGTDASIWDEKGENRYPYLRSREMGREEGRENVKWKPEKETEFVSFISQKHSRHIEQDEAWYRWFYKHQETDIIKEKISNMISKESPYLMIVGIDKISGGEKREKKEEENEKNKQELSEELWEEAMLREQIENGNYRITDILVEKRGTGGVIQTLLICTDLAEIRVENEYQIRSLLADGTSFAFLQNGKSYACNHLLPSAFFAITTVKEEGEVSGLHLTGGGFGHGVGMSQNGAKKLADLGYSAKEILEYYYQGCEVRE